MKQKPTIGTAIAVLVKENQEVIKAKTVISDVFGQWIYADGFPNIRWHWLDDRRNETVWKNKSGAMKIL